MTTLEQQVLIIQDRAIAQAENLIAEIECMNHFHLNAKEYDREMGRPF